MPTQSPFDITKFINTTQVGGIDSYVIDDGDGRGVRALCVNTGGGLRYRVLADRGLDIDQAFHNNISLAMLAHKGITAPTRALDRDQDFLKGFPVGLLTTCGPTNIGGPASTTAKSWASTGRTPTPRPPSNPSSSPIPAPAGST